jgi:hypothetical protein
MFVFTFTDPDMNFFKNPFGKLGTTGTRMQMSHKGKIQKQVLPGNLALGFSKDQVMAICR